MLDALEQDASELQKIAPRVCLEIGCVQSQKYFDLRSTLAVLVQDALPVSWELFSGARVVS